MHARSRTHHLTAALTVAAVHTGALAVNGALPGGYATGAKNHIGLGVRHNF